MIRAGLAVLALLGASAPARASAVAVEQPGLRYVCGDGTEVEARYIGVDRALVRFMGRTMAMVAGPAASGVRYVGGGWQWWTRGMRDGMIAPVRPGATIAADPGQTCTVPEKRR